MRPTETHGAHEAINWVFMTLATGALVTNFLWFETVERLALLDLAVGIQDGRNTSFLTFFLIGMGAAAAFGVAAPRRMKNHWKRWTPWCAIVGCVASAAIAYGSQIAPSAFAATSPVAFVVTGFVNVVLLLVDTILLAYIADRRLMSLAVVAVFVLRTVCLAGLDVGTGAISRAAAVFLPIACVVLTLAASARIGSVEHERFDAHVRLTTPASHTMVTLLVLAAVAYAVTVSILTFDYWQPGLFTSIHPVAFLVGAAVFILVAYFTLLATRSDFLMRFLPGLFVLLVANVLVGAIGNGALPSGESLGTVLGLFTGMYCETYAWLLLLYAVRMLDMQPFRLVGMFLLIEAVTEGALYAIGGMPAASGGLGAVVPMILLVVLALIWNMHQLYQVGTRFEFSGCATCPLRVAATAKAPLEQPGSHSIEAASAPKGNPNEQRRALAKSRGLSERETDVFVLLAQGYSRRYIGDELFISYGTVSTHTSRIYEKFGVHSKQELLTLVNEAGDDGHSGGCAVPG